MTRETKAGLVVSCSFLCLVGIVLVSKLRETQPSDSTTPETNSEGLVKAPDAPAPSQDVNSSAASEQRSTEKNGLAQKNQKQDPKVIPAVFPGDGVASNLPKSGSTIVQNGSKTQPAAPRGSVTATEKDKDNASAAIDDNGPAMDLDKDKGSLAGQPARSIIVAQPTPKTEKASMLDAMPDSMKRKATSLQGMGLRPSGDIDTTRLAAQTQPASAAGGTQNAAAGNQKPLIDLPPLPPLQPKTDAKPDAARLSKPFIIGAIGAPATVPTAAPAAAAAGAAAAPLNSGNNSAAATDSAGLSGSGNKSTNADGSSSTSDVDHGNAPRTGLVGIVPLPAGPVQDKNPAAGNAQNQPAGALQQDRQQPLINPPQSVKLDTPILPAPITQATRSSVSEEDANRSRAPLGAPMPAVNPIVAPTVPVAAASAAAGPPQVESYDEDTYTCKANDTFRSVSQAVYQTDAYDQALLLFNRNHPLANDSIKQNPPQLQAGQPIYIPPLRILRKYYAASTPEVKDAAPARTEGPAPIQAITAVPSPATRSYRVGANAEMIRDIARRTLGNGDRWTEIYQLNRNLDPTYAVPAGTEVKLPADARVDAR
jgi:hypothetical protein